jgi:hypothetical protein
MTYDELFDELKQLALQLALPLRFEIGDFDGGLCVVHEERVCILNKRHPVQRKISALALALAQCGLDGLFVKPAVREAIDDEIAKARALLAAQQPAAS